MPGKENSSIDLDVFEGGTLYLHYGTDHQIEIGKVKEVKFTKRKDIIQWIKKIVFCIKSYLH